MAEIQAHEVYTTSEAQTLLKVSNSTIKRLLKKGIIRANKIGGQYRILGKELLQLLSPQVERKTIRLYQRVKKHVKKTLKNW